MSFGGHVAAMVASIRNNKALLGKRRSYFKNKIELQKVSDKMKISYPDATPEDMRRVKAKLKKQRIIKRLITLTVLVLLSPVFYYVGKNVVSVIAEEIPYTDAQLVGMYYDEIKLGDDYLRKNDYESAIIIYWRAADIKYTEDVDYRLALAYTYKCLIVNEDCGEASWHLKRLYRHDKKDKAAKELRKLLVNTYNLNNPNDSILNSNTDEIEGSIWESYFNR